MNLDLHYTDPRLAELYDLANPLGADSAFYLRMADETHARVIVDFGCGTGLLTREFASGERSVTGIDPAPAMLAIARRNDPGELDPWRPRVTRRTGSRSADNDGQCRASLSG
jgi:2-polyprenyl-3-methyl-5-hydroxy-6-metoxy-1,4-benzoquinol methylase